MSDSQKQPIYANKTVLTVGTVAALLIVIIGPVMWAAKKEAEISSLNILVNELRTRVNTVEGRLADTDVWRGKLDVTLTNIAKEISEIKRAVEK